MGILIVLAVAGIVAAAVYLTRGKVVEEAKPPPPNILQEAIDKGLLTDSVEAAMADAEKCLLEPPGRLELEAIYGPAEVARMTQAQLDAEIERLVRLQQGGYLSPIPADDLPYWTRAPGSGANPYRDEQFAMLQRIIALRAQAYQLWKDGELAPAMLHLDMSDYMPLGSIHTRNILAEFEEFMARWRNNPPIYSIMALQAVSSFLRGSQDTLERALRYNYAYTGGEMPR